MNQRSLIAIIILAGIGSITAVSAYSGSISAAQGNFNNVLVTGTCSGCGGGEGSFTNWNTVLLNTTSSFHSNNCESQFYVGNDGSVSADGDFNNFLVYKNGTMISGTSWNNCFGGIDVSQSSTGQYKLFINGNSTYSPVIYKNGQFLTSIDIDITQFENNFGRQIKAIGMSPDGHYIAIVGLDNLNGSSERIIILEGS